MDSATQGEGPYVHMYVVCRTSGAAFQASPKLAHRSMGLMHLNWVRLDPAFQAPSCGSGWVLPAPQVSYPSWTSSYPELALHMANGRNSREPMETSDATRVLSHELSHCLLHTPFIGKLQCGRAGIPSHMAKAMDA